MKRILIIGGGAAGIAAALTAKHHAPEAEVLLLERLDRVGKKILATGNGRCNLTNMQAGMPHFHSSAWCVQLRSTTLSGKGLGKLCQGHPRRPVPAHPAPDLCLAQSASHR